MNILCFDIEEWFHLFEDHNNAVETDWVKFKKTLPRTIDLILEPLIEKNIKATFFCIGWVAREYPEIIKKISNSGFEIGSHSDLHYIAHKQNKKEFTDDLVRSIKSIEDVIGKRVVSFRAPGFSVKDSNKWIFEVLLENGIIYDSSVFPVIGKFGGFGNMPENKPFIIKKNGMLLKEFPLNSYNLYGRKVIFSGGGFFRLLPYSFIKYFMNHSDYIITYLHARDFDPNQPFSELSTIRSIKSKIGVKGSLNKFMKMINDYEFINISTANELVNWNLAEIVNI